MEEELASGELAESVEGPKNLSDSAEGYIPVQWTRKKIALAVAVGVVVAALSLGCAAALYLHTLDLALTGGMDTAQQDDLAEAFRRVHLFLNPDGLFVFDINTPAKFSRIDGESYVREDDGVFCVWQAAVEDGLCAYQFDIFEQDGDSWSRAQETHEERVYEPQQLVRMLEEAGFTEIKTYGDQSFAPVKGGEDRIYFTARKRD